MNANNVGHLCTRSLVAALGSERLRHIWRKSFRITFLGNDSVGGIPSQSSISKTSNILTLHTFLIPRTWSSLWEVVSIREESLRLSTASAIAANAIAVMMTESRLFASRIAALPPVHKMSDSAAPL